MARLALIIGSLYGFLAVILGAFGAHGLRNMMPTEKIHLIDSFDTGVKYQMYHALVLLFLGAYMHFSQIENGILPRATQFIIWGTLLFSGSIYVLVMVGMKDSIGLGKFGIITPIGGLLMIIGWAMMIYHFWTSTSLK